MASGIVDVIAATLRALAQRVEVAEGEVRITGSKPRLLQTLVAGNGVNAVPTQGLKWRKVKDEVRTWSQERAGATAREGAPAEALSEAKPP